MKIHVLVALLAFWCCAALYPESVYHLKEKVSVGQGDIALKDMIEETLPVNIDRRLTAGKTYQNAEISSMLLEAGLKDFILIGGASDVNAVPETSAPAMNNTDVYGRMENPVLTDGGPSERFFLRIIDRNTGDAVFHKGTITIITRVKIVRRSEADGYLVQNPYSGKRFTVPAENPEETSER